MRFRHSLLTSLALFLYLHLAATARYPVVARQDDGPSSVESQAPTATDRDSSEPSTTPAPSIESSIASIESSRPSSTRGDAVASTTISVTASTVIQAPATAVSNEASPTSTADAGSDNPLPIHPKITPALGLSGVILLITGAVYAVIGIKNKWLYVFASAAYLTSLAVTVLIVYLMSPPVSNAVQGAFFVAAFLSGLIFGALSLVFSDITDGLGCLLGGFCLSMWFLTLKEGGLITSTSGRAIFIGCMSVAGYGLSFSHHTRTYGLMVSISFAGATITMLGVDCLSRAGLKEFWLYLWDLNPDTFPLHTDTYPITRAIKVEIACIVLLCVFGIISQMRLWRIVKERREKSAAMRLEREQNKEREEEELGRRIEDDFVRERAEWEATYGDKGLQDTSVGSSGTTPKTSTSIKEKELSSSESIEMVPLSKERTRKSASKHISTGAAITVTVLEEDEIQQIDDQGNPIPPKKDRVAHSIAPINDDSGSRPSVDDHSSNDPPRSISARSSLRSSVPPPPAVVPLPFKIPQEEDVQSDEDKASVSAVPESMHESDSIRRSLSKRLSQMSGMKRFSINRALSDHSESEVALVIPHIEDDRASSVAATLDMGDDGISLSEVSTPRSPLNMDLDSKDDTGRLQDSVTFEGTLGTEMLRTNSRKELAEEDEKCVSLLNPNMDRSGTEAVSEHSTTEKNEYQDTAAIRQSLTVSTNPKPVQTQARCTSSNSPRMRSDTVVSASKEDGERTQQSRSTKSSPPSQSSRTERTESKFGSFREALPDKLSKVALSYRTNEWAKHLEAADRPELDQLHEPESPGVKLEFGSQERPAPVSNEIAQPLLVAKRSSKRISSSSNAYRNSGFARSSSNPSPNSPVEPQSLSRSPSVLAAGGVLRSASGAQNHGMRSSSTPLLTPTEPIDGRQSMVPSPVPENTLLGQREELVRNRVTSQSFTPHSSSQNLLSSGELENMTLAQRKRMLQTQKPPSTSQKWRQSGWAAGSQIQGFDSHQPKRSSGSGSDQKREVLLAGWRESMKQDAPHMQTVTLGEEQRRAAMMNERRQKEMEKQQRAMAAQQRESMMDNMMRSGEMLDAHREAMRRMQASANRHV